LFAKALIAVIPLLLFSTPLIAAKALEKEDITKTKPINSTFFIFKKPFFTLLINKASPTSLVLTDNFIN